MKTLLVFVILLMIGCDSREPPEPASQKVRFAKIQTLSTSTIYQDLKFPGKVEAMQTTDLSFEVPGRLESVAFKEGEDISGGELIAKLDSKIFALAVREAEVQLKLSLQDLSRKKTLLSKKGIAKSIVDDAQTNFELMEVKLAQAKKRLQDTMIFAPFDAYVSKVYFDNFVNLAAGIPVVKVHDLRRLKIVISVPETLMATADPKSIRDVWAQFSFAGDQRFPVTYHESSGEADQLALTYEVAFLINPPAAMNLLPGMTATVTIKVDSSNSQDIYLPTSAIVSTPDNSLAVWVYDESTGLVERRKIKTLSPTNNGIPVSEGLLAGDKVVVSGASQLQEGIKVRPLE
mgnify:CR=1 FL=1